MSGQLLTLPDDRAIVLTPELWLAIGVLSYNHALLARQPLRVLGARELIAEIPEEKYRALDQGQAAITDARALTAETLKAAIRITRTLLEPLHVSVTQLGNQQTGVYLLLEHHAGADGLRILPATEVAA